MSVSAAETTSQHAKTSGTSSQQTVWQEFTLGTGADVFRRLKGVTGQLGAGAYGQVFRCRTTLCLHDHCTASPAPQAM